MKFFVYLVFSITILFSQENKTVKTSELELFLFKVGFESLLKDVKINKDKSSLNETELVKLNEKIELIMNEIYKDKRVLNTDINTIENSELMSLKEEVKKLREEINLLKTQKRSNIVAIKKTKKIVSSSKNATVKNKEVFLRDKALPTAQIVGKVYKGDILEIETCDRFGWCKIKDKDVFISKFTLNL